MGARQRVGPLRVEEVRAIRVRMAELGYRRDAELARAAGVGTSDLSLLLNRRREPSLHVVRRLARALGWSMERVIGDPEDAAPPAQAADGQARRTRRMEQRIGEALASLTAALAPEPDGDPAREPVDVSDRLNSDSGGRGRRTAPHDSANDNENRRRPYLVAPNGRGAAASAGQTDRAA